MTKEKFYWCDENGLSLLEDALKYLKEGTDDPKYLLLTYVATLKAIDKLTWFLGNEIKEMKELNSLPEVEEGEY